MRIAVYARVSTFDQTTENQRAELSDYTAARGWTIVREFIDEGISGTRESRPALDAMMKEAKRRKFDAVVCWRLDRLGRNLRDLVTLISDLQAVGVALVSLNEGIDLSTPAGRLQMHVLAALAEFERERIRERVRAGIARAKAQGRRLGRRRARAPPVALPNGLTVRDAAAQWGVSKSTAARSITEGKLPSVGQTPSSEGAVSPGVC